MSKRFVVIPKVVFAVAIFVLAGGMFNESRGDVEPTHYLFMPTARVNKAGSVVLGLHEISYALPGKLQLQASLIDNIGRLNLAAKYGFHKDLAGGVGLAWTLINGGLFMRNPDDRGHAIKHQYDPRIGGFLTYEFGRPYYGLVLTGNTQIGDHFSVGADLGGRITPSKAWAFLWETGLSADLTDGTLYLYGIGGLRFNVADPGLFIDAGVQTNEFNVDGFKMKAGLFLDVMYCFKP